MDAYRRERRIADTLRRCLLMEPEVNQFHGLSLGVAYAASALEEAAVGGDFFDAFALPGGEVALLVGDVTGEGRNVAMRIAAVKYALRALRRDLRQPAPGAALCRLNRFVAQSLLLDEWERPNSSALLWWLSIR